MPAYFPKHLCSDDESLQHWTEKVDREAIELFDTLSEKEIRTRQSITREQITAAFKQNNVRALLDLQRQEEALGQAMLRRLGR